MYHVTSRGDRREDIYLDDDRAAGLAVIGDVCAHFNWIVRAYCLIWGLCAPCIPRHAEKRSANVTTRGKGVCSSDRTAMA
ncbi:hypothetical protein [Nitrosomonas sp. ANs5]|uniref:hypothetical protein n=1 Tax=Nitrosomonas sp. ANs5 TaxID=3423941 RepID=UPI003D32696A